VIGKNSGWEKELMSKINELKEELHTVFSGRGVNLLDSILPLMIFLILNALTDLRYALWGAIIIAIAFTIHRLVKKDKLLYALAGFGGVLLAAGFVKLSGSEAGFFLPGFISGGITIVLCVGSVFAGRPLAAWTSYLTRRWTLEWYWHGRVRPAYTGVTLFWAVAFSGRTALEYWLFQQEAVNALGAVKIVLGWPYTLLVLVLSYLYGIWRLGELKGPSVAEFVEGKEAPWEGQKRGF
jgi:hypothetical protein